MTIRLNTNFTTTGFIDYYYKPWISYGLTSPQHGIQKGLKILFTEGKSSTSYLLFRWQASQSDAFVNTNLPTGAPYKSQQIRWHSCISPSFGWTIQFRVELKNAESPNTSAKWGHLMYVDVNYHTLKLPVHIGFRMTVFNTRDYNSGIYSREDVLPYSYEQSINYGRGTSCYLIVQTRLSRRIDAGIKVGQTKTYDRWMTDDLTGIAGKNKLFISTQIRLKFN
jgi:hypothetical protein